MAARPIAVIAVLAAAGLALVARTSNGGADAVPASSCGAVGLEPATLGVEESRRLILCLLNEERASHGLAPLRQRAELELASQHHSEDMVARRFFEHDTPEGVDPQQRMLAAGYRSDNAITGENIAWAAGERATPFEVMDLWMHSPPHRVNILRREFTEVGVGVAPGAPVTPRSDGAPWTFTTDFGGPPIR